MKIYALDSENENFQELINQLAEKISIDLFDDFETLFNEIEVDCTGVLIDFDEKPKVKNKLIAKLKKSYQDLNIFLLANSLDAKKLAKHQNSKTGAHLYFQTPLDEELLSMMLEPFIEIDELSETDVIQEHTSSADISDNANEVSENIDGVFSSTFVEEYSEPSEEISMGQADEPSLGDMGELQIDANSDLDEISLDGDSEQDEIGEISMVGIDIDEASEDLTEHQAEEMPETEEDDGFALSLDNSDSAEEDWSDDSDLSLAEDGDENVSENSMFPDEDDLSFPEIDIDPLALADENDTDTVSESNHNELSLGEDDDNELKLGDETSPSQVFKLDEDKDSSGINLDSEQEMDAAGDMNTNVSLISGLDHNLDSDNEDNDNEESELTEPGMGLDAFDFGSDSNESEAEEESSEPAFNLSESADENEVGELTAGAFKVNIPESSFEAKDQEDIGSLLEQNSQHESQLAAEESLVLHETEEEAPQNDNSAREHNEDDTIEGVSLPQEILSEIEPVEMTKTSIALDQNSLTSINLPEELPDFSTSAQNKLSEIDDMIMEEEAPSPLIDDGTLVASDYDQQTNIYQSQGITEDTVVMDSSSPTQVQSVSQDLKEEHRTYVQSHDEELLRLGETIKSLREDRDRLSEKILSFESVKDNKEKDFLSIQAKLDEKNIELVVVKKRMEKQIDDLRFQLDIALDKKSLLAKQNEQMQEEVERLSRQKQMDVNKVRSRERELEEKLELLRQDAEVQIKNREYKILELKRRIDTLEFDIENSHVNEKKSVSSQMDLQDKMDKVIKTLRGAIGQLEDDYGADERKTRIKKNLDI